MSDLLNDARDLRQKLQRLEVLLQIEKGRRPRGWFSSAPADDPERAAAIARLVKTGLVEPAPPPAHYRVTSDGRAFLKDVRAKVGDHGPLDWTRADEIDFSKL